MLKIPLLALAGLVGWAALPAPACPGCQRLLQPQYVVLTVHGKLDAKPLSPELDAKPLSPEPGSAVVRSDGTVTAGGTAYRVEYGADQALRELARKLHGQRVVLTGRLEQRLIPVIR